MEGGGPSTEQRVPSSSSSGGEEELDELEKYLLGHAAEGLPPPPKAPGTRVAAPLDRQVQELCLQLCEWQFNRSFPGSQPVSLDRRNLKDIVKNIKGYYISEKSDGTRFLLLIMHDGSYLVDRSFRVTKVELRFPFPARKATPASPPVLDRTLIDGELVCDVVEGNKQVLTFLMYDIVAWMGVNVAKRDLPDRLKIIQNDVLGPRKEDKSHDYSKEPFKLRLKDFFEIKYLPYVFKEVIPHLHHQNDGIIFTPVRFPYTPGTCKQMLKWKPSAINSVDFELKVEYRNRQRGYSLLAAERLAKRFYAWITFTPEQKQMFDNDKQASGKIVECVWDPSWKTWIPAARAETWDEGEWQAGGWRFLRIRDDKNLANDVSVIERIQRSRADNLKSGQLLSVLCGGEHGSPHHHHHPQPHLRRSGSTEFRRSSTDGINFSASSQKRKMSTEEATPNHPQHKQKQEHHQHHQQTNLSSNAVLSSSFSNDINNNSTTKEKKPDEPYKAKERTEDKQKDEGDEEDEEEAPTQPAPSKKQRIDFLLSSTVPDSAAASLDPHSFFTSSSSSSASSSSSYDGPYSLPSLVSSASPPPSTKRKEDNVETSADSSRP
ncbi:mRNA guanylyltransferase [Balamuthia mandrillaris]